MGGLECPSRSGGPAWWWGPHPAARIVAMARSHKVDISGLLAGSRQRMLLDDEVSDRAVSRESNSRAGRVHLELHCVDRLLHIEGTVDVRAHGACDSCLEDVDAAGARRRRRTARSADGATTTRSARATCSTGDRLDVADLAQQLVLSDIADGACAAATTARACARCAERTRIRARARAASVNNGDSRGKSKMEDAAQ